MAEEEQRTPGPQAAPVTQLHSVSSTDLPGNGPQRRLLRGVDSLVKLIDANKSDDDDIFNKTVRAFEKENGHIENAYFTRGKESCAVVVARTRPRRSLAAKAARLCRRSKRRDGESPRTTRDGESGGTTPEEATKPHQEGQSGGSDWASSTDKRRIVLVRLDRRDLALQVPLFDDAVWRTILMARQTEYRATRLLSHAASGVVANVLYTVAVYLLSALDNVSECGKKKRHEQAEENGLKPAEKNLESAEKSFEPADKAKKAKKAEKAEKAEKGLTPAEKTTLANAAKVAMSHLDKLEEYVKRTGVTTAIRYYLIGLPVGLAVIGMVVLFIYMRFEFTGSSKLFVTTIAAGAIGSVASVMFRITRGQTLSVNIDQGGLVTIINGAFRPLVGAVFGVALYILVQGQLLPLDDPGAVGSATRIQQFFYAGLAFLAGFSERWAQDTILQSRPLAPSPAKAAQGSPLRESEPSN